MTKSRIDKTFATILCAAAIGSMSIQPRAQATPVFPPEHLAPQAVFATPASVAAGPVVGAWYRTTVSRIDLRPDRMLVDVMPGAIVPWYRAAN